MPYVYESNASQASSEDGSLELTLRIADVYDREQAIGLAFAAAPAVFQSRIRAERPNLRPAGFGLWDATFKYSLPEDDEQEQEKPPEGGSTAGTIEFDTTGGTMHVSTAIAQRHQPANAANRRRAIGVSWNDGNPQVEGVDVVVPSFRFSLTKQFSPTALREGKYFLDLSRMTGKTNNATYTVKGRFQGVNLELEFEKGELLFLGARGSGRGSASFEINFQFESQQNNPNFTVDAAIPAIVKDGHEYAWVAFKNEENANTLVQTPIAVYVAQVYESADYKSIMGF